MTSSVASHNCLFVTSHDCFVFTSQHNTSIIAHHTHHSSSHSSRLSSVIVKCSVLLGVEVVFVFFPLININLPLTPALISLHIFFSSPCSIFAAQYLSKPKSVLSISFPQFQCLSIVSFIPGLAFKHAFLLINLFSCNSCIALAFRFF